MKARDPSRPKAELALFSLAQKFGVNCEKWIRHQRVLFEVGPGILIANKLWDILLRNQQISGLEIQYGYKVRSSRSSWPVNKLVQLINTFWIFSDFTITQIRSQSRCQIGHEIIVCLPYLMTH